MPQQTNKVFNQERDEMEHPVEAPKAQRDPCWWPEGGGGRAHEEGEGHAGEVQDRTPPGGKQWWMIPFPRTAGSAARGRRRWSNCDWSERP